MPGKKCDLNFKKRHFEKNLKTWPFSNYCLCRLVECISMKVGTFVKWSLLVITNKSAKICLNIFEDSVIQSLKNGKTRKSSLVLMLRQRKLADLFLVLTV